MAAAAPTIRRIVQYNIYEGLTAGGQQALDDMGAWLRALEPPADFLSLNEVQLCHTHMVAFVSNMRLACPQAPHAHTHFS